MTATETPAMARMIQPRQRDSSVTKERSSDEENERGLERSDHETSTMLVSRTAL